MNKIYSKVWNNSLGQMVVASGVVRAPWLRRSLLFVAMALLLQGWSQASQATTYSPVTCTSVGPGILVG